MEQVPMEQPGHSVVMISWLGSSCLNPEAAERELLAMRTKAFLRKDVQEMSAGEGQTSRHSGRYCQQQLGRKANKATMASRGRVKQHHQCHSRSSHQINGLTTDELILAYQEETQILRQALVADRSDYRRAQFCMDKLGDLEILLWESHGAESRASTNLSVERLQREQGTEQATLERDFEQREERLRDSCAQQAQRLEKEREQDTQRQLSLQSQRQCHHRSPHRPALTMTGKSGGGSGTTSIASGERLQKMPITATHEGDVDMTKNTVTEMTRETAVAGEGALSEGATKYDNYFVTKQDHSLTHQKDKSQQQGQDEDMQTLVRSTATPSQPAHPLAPDSRMLARNREIVELRLELMKHLAVAHEDGGRNLQEATRVMSLLSNLESRALSESKTTARADLGHLKLLLQQKTSRAVEIQREKHKRLLRSLERARSDALHVLAARHRGALSRLTESRRDEERLQKQNLRKRLAEAKGNVARAWKAHNHGILGETRPPPKIPLTSQCTRSTSSSPHHSAAFPTTAIAAVAGAAASSHGKESGGVAEVRGLFSSSICGREDFTGGGNGGLDSSGNCGVSAAREGQRNNGVSRHEGKTRDVVVSSREQQQQQQQQHNPGEASAKDRDGTNRNFEDLIRNLGDERRGGERQGVTNTDSACTTAASANNSDRTGAGGSTALPEHVAVPSAAPALVADANVRRAGSSTSRSRNRPRKVGSRGNDGDGAGGKRNDGTATKSPPGRHVPTGATSPRKPRQKRTSEKGHENDDGKEGKSMEKTHTQTQTTAAALSLGIDVLDAEEIEALAALGRWAPNDPRRLLGGFSSAAASTTSTDRVLSLGFSSHSGGGGRGSGSVGGEELYGAWDDAVVQRAAEKLAAGMQMEEDMTRRRLHLCI